MKRILFFCFTFLCFFKIEAQHQCGTPPLTDNQREVLYNNIYSKSNQPKPKNAGMTCVPLNPNIVRDSNGNGGVTLEGLSILISYLNHEYLEAGIEFYWAYPPSYANNDDYLNFNQTSPDSDTENGLLSLFPVPNDAVNIYFTDSIVTPSGFVAGGYAYYPFDDPDFNIILIQNDLAAATYDRGVTAKHELGHFFGLPHTFEGTSYGNTDPGAEHVPRTGSNSNCDMAGDYICDTEADPGYAAATFDQADCLYIGSEADVFGNTYTPITSNIMSYFPRSCIENFTPGQYDILQLGLAERQTYVTYTMDALPMNVQDPTNFTVTLNGGLIDFEWTDNANNEIGYVIEMSSTSATSGFRAVERLATGADDATVSYGGIQGNNSTYYFRVKAVNDGCNEYSNVDSVFIEGCLASGNLCDEHISRVQLNTIDNSSACTVEGYHDYTAISTDLTINNNYTVTVDNVQNYPGDQCGVWIDWNQDNDFDDANETFAVVDGPDVFTSNFTVPAGALLGNTKMRIRIHYNNEETDPCGATVYGEVEDYTINVIDNGCNIISVAAGAQTSCDILNNTYSQDITIAYVNEPTGTIDINGQVFAQTGSPQTETLINLIADGNQVNVTAFFTNETACAFTQNNTFIAPVSCACTAVNSTDIQSACGSFTWIDGVTYTSSNNTAMDTLVGAAANGCASVVTLDLTILPNETATDVQSACNSYTWIDGVNYTSSNNAATFVVNGNGGDCDTIYTLDLTILPNETATDVQSACNSYTWIDGVNYTSSNNAATFVVNGNGGDCDTIYILDLTINNSITTTETITACDSANINGVWYTVSQTVTDIYTAVSGCDSTHITNLTINNSTTTTQIEVVCGSYTWSVDGMTYTTSGMYTFVGTNAVGCTETKILDLTINNSFTTTELITICSGEDYTFPDGTVETNITSVVTNTSVETLPNGCTNTIITTVTPEGILGIAVGMQSACNPLNNTYSQELVLTYNTESGTINVNGQLFTAIGSPQTITLTGLDADGMSENIYAYFTSNNCVYSTIDAFTAPENCQVAGCPIYDVALLSQTECNLSTNTYSQDLIIYYENAPLTGSLVVNNQVFSVTGSPQTISLSDLEADGDLVDLFASFSVNPTNCIYTRSDLFSSPSPCGNVGIRDEFVEGTKVYSTDNTIVVDLTETNIEGVTEVDIFSILGQLIVEGNIEKNNFENYQIDASIGYYVVRLVNKNQFATYKIYVGK